MELGNWARGNVNADSAIVVLSYRPRHYLPCHGSHVDASRAIRECLCFRCRRWSLYKYVFTVHAIPHT